MPRSQEQDYLPLKRREFDAAIALYDLGLPEEMYSDGPTLIGMAELAAIALRVPLDHVAHARVLNSFLRMRVIHYAAEHNGEYPTALTLTFGKTRVTVETVPIRAEGASPDSAPAFPTFTATVSGPSGAATADGPEPLVAIARALAAAGIAAPTIIAAATTPEFYGRKA